MESLKDCKRVAIVCKEPRRCMMYAAEIIANHSTSILSMVMFDDLGKPNIKYDKWAMIIFVSTGSFEMAKKYNKDIDFDNHQGILIVYSRTMAFLQKKYYDRIILTQLSLVSKDSYIYRDIFEDDKIPKNFRHAIIKY